MEKNVKLEFNLSTDNFKLLENDGYCSVAEVDFLHVGTNRNQCNISEECVKKSLNSFYNKPLLAILDNSFEPSLATDFTEHARTDNERNKFIAFGTIPESSTFSFVERENEKKYLTAKVVIWKNYFPIIMNILKNKDSHTKVSIELAVIDGKQDKNDGILYINEFRLLSCVMLGEDVMEGIEGSKLDVLRFSYDKEIKKANEYYLKFSSKEYEIPVSIKDSINNVLNTSFDRKACSKEDIKFSKMLCDNIVINKEQFNKLTDNLNNSHSKLIFSLFGGEESKKWVNSIIEREKNFMFDSLSDSELRDDISAIISQYKYGEYDYNKYYISEIYSDEKIIIITDNEDGKLYRVPYLINNNNEIEVEMQNKIEVCRTYEDVEDKTQFNSFVFSKDEYGKGEALKIDKTKDSLSDDSWGSINKSELRKKILNAKNYKELVKYVYMLVEEGWEDSPSSKLKYPVMQIKDGKIVYNRYGLSSALGYAKKENVDEVVKKIEKIYKELDINNEKEGGDKKMEKELDKEEVKKNAEKEDIEKKSEKEDMKKKNAQEDVAEKKDDKEAVEKKSEKEDIEKNAEKEEFEKQINSLEEKCSKMETELNKYKRAEEEKKMSDEIDEFAHCMSEDEAKELKNSVKECSYDEMKEKLNKKIADFALKMKDKAVEKKDFSYTINPYFDMKLFDESNSEKKGLDNIVNNSSIEIGLK